MKTIAILGVVALGAGLGLGAMTAGCAGVGQFTPQGAAVANNAVSVAQGLLSALDSFYADLLNLKLVPDYQVEATRALAVADTAAGVLRQVITGATVTDTQLNVAAGQVYGARAMLGVMR
jgi:hypothetical protein